MSDAGAVVGVGTGQRARAAAGCALRLDGCARFGGELRHRGLQRAPRRLVRSERVRWDGNVSIILYGGEIEFANKSPILK